MSEPTQLALGAATPSRNDISLARKRLDISLPLHTLLPRLRALSVRLRQARVLVRSFPSLHSSLQRAAHSILRLCEAAGASATSFRSAASRSACAAFDAHTLLLSSRRAAAGALLRNARAKARTLSEEARNLALKFESAASEVEHARSEAARAHAETTVKARDVRRRRSTLDVELQHARSARYAKEVDAAEAQALYEEAREKEMTASNRAAIANAARVAAMGVAVVAARSARAGIIGATGVGMLSAGLEAQVLRAREEKAVHLHRRQVARDEALGIDGDIREIEVKLCGNIEEECVSEKAVKEIEECVEQLRMLSAVMLQAEGFWMRVGSLCEDVTNHRDGEEVDDGVGGVRDEIMLREIGNEVQLKNVLANWTALYEACDEWVAGMNETRESIYEDVQADDWENDVHIEDEIEDEIHEGHTHGECQQQREEEAIEL